MCVCFVVVFFVSRRNISFTMAVVFICSRWILLAIHFWLSILLFLPEFDAEYFVNLIVVFYRYQEGTCWFYFLSCCDN